MTVTLELEPEVELTATKQAEAEGLPLAKYVESVVREAIFKRRRVEQLAQKSFDEILKPFRDEVEASRMSDDELDGLFRQARREVSAFARKLPSRRKESAREALKRESKFCRKV